MPLFLSSRAPSLAPPRAVFRSGFTLVELMVSLVLLDLALLGLVAASAVAAKQFADARTRSRAAAVAQTRLEWAASQPCTVAQAGTTIPDHGLRESWSLSTPIRETVLVTDTVEITSGVTVARQVYVSRVTC